MRRVECETVLIECDETETMLGQPLPDYVTAILRRVANGREVYAIELILRHVREWQPGWNPPTDEYEGASARVRFLDGGRPVELNDRDAALLAEAFEVFV